MCAHQGSHAPAYDTPAMVDGGSRINKAYYIDYRGRYSKSKKTDRPIAFKVLIEEKREMSGKFLSGERFAEIREAIDSGDPLRVGAYEQLMKRAEEALGRPRLSVRENGGSPFFRQDAAYLPGRDGVRNVEGNHESGNLAGRFSSASLTLALAYRLSSL